MTHDRPRVEILCRRHEHELIVHDLEIPESGPWKPAMLYAQMLLFSKVAGDPRVVARIDGDDHNLSLVLAEIGCMACFAPDVYERAVRVLRKGLSHAARVVVGSPGSGLDPGQWHPVDEEQGG
jgi:hypothetical protein